MYVYVYISTSVSTSAFMPMPISISVHLPQHIDTQKYQVLVSVIIKFNTDKEEMAIEFHKFMKLSIFTVLTFLSVSQSVQLLSHV